jgi:GNAT superfamily N-acetyltransferase
MPDYRISEDMTEIDLELVHRWLSTESYWARGRSRETLTTAMAGSRNYAIFTVDTDTQVGFARVITDGATFAWLADVFVDGDWRGRGVGTELIRGIVDSLEPLGLKRFALFTADAHGLYEKFGFRSLPDSSGWMLLPGPGFGRDV